MTDLLNFYNNLITVNNIPNYRFNDIVFEWDDNKLENEHYFIQWLFPDKIGGNSPKLTQNDIDIFKTDSKIRLSVITATLRMLFFYGFIVNKNLTVDQVRPLYRHKNGNPIGLFSPHNYKRITRILNFLVIIDMEYLSSLFFLAMCNAVKTNNQLRDIVNLNKSFPTWKNTQRYLINDEWKEDENINLENVKLLPVKLDCRNIKGLNFTGNSCYMDSLLMALFIVPNATITNNILTKNLNTLKNEQRLWFKCPGMDLDEDISRRTAIQKSLIQITNSIRGLDTTNKCSLLRKQINECPHPIQEFHNRDIQDSGEFLQYLFSLFQVNVATRKRKTYGSNDMKKWVKTSKFLSSKESPIISITPQDLINLGKGERSIEHIKESLANESTMVMDYIAPASGLILNKIEFDA